MKMKEKADVRGAKNAGLGVKIKTLIDSGKVGGVESPAEHIFKNVIVHEVKQSGLEKILGKKIDKLNYEDITDEFKKQFAGKDINDKTVTELFDKKIIREEQGSQQLKMEQKKIAGNKTVGQMFGGSGRMFG